MPQINPEPHHDYRTIVCVSCLHTFRVAQKCHNRFCNVCTGSSRSRVRHKLNFIVKNYLPPAGHMFKHITLTIKSESDARNMQKHLLSSFRRLRQRQLWTRLVDGGAYVCEIGGSPGHWHLHLHILCSALRIPWHKLLADWKRVSGSKGVYIQNCNKTAIIGYITKYISKSDVIPEHQLEASTLLKGARLFQPFGRWHSLERQAPKRKPCCPSCGATNLECLDFEFRPQNPIYHKDIGWNNSSRPPPSIANSADIIL